MRTPWIIAAAMAAGALYSAKAGAQTGQPWLRGQGAEAGIGIRAGDLEIHPGLAGELGYDSNWFQSAGVDAQNNVNEPIVPSFQYRLTPSLTLKTIGKRRTQQDGTVALPPKIDFRSTLSARLGGLNALDRSFAEPVDRVTVGADLGAALNILPERPWGAGIALNFARLQQPNSDPGNVDGAFDRTGVSGLFDIKWRPGGGLFEWKLGYDARLTVYDNSSLGLDRLRHGIHTNGRWKFLPRTALLYDGSIQFLTHTQDGTRQRDATPISSQIGVNGLVSARLGLLALGGWKGMFYEANVGGDVDDFDGPIGRVELTWYFASRRDLDDGSAGSSESTWRLGYQHDAANSGISNFYTIDRIYTQFNHPIGHSLSLSLRGGISLVSHATPRDARGRVLTTSGELKEWRPGASLFAEYRVTDTFAIFSNSGFSASPADNFLRVPSTLDVPSDRQENLKYFRFTTFLGGRWFM